MQLISHYIVSENIYCKNCFNLITEMKYFSSLWHYILVLYNSIEKESAFYNIINYSTTISNIFK